MDGFIGLLILLILVVPFIVGIWLIARAVTARNQIEELSGRVDYLQSQLDKLKQAPPAAAKTTEEKAAPFTPAVIPPRKAEAAAMPAPATPTPASPPVPVLVPEIPPLTEPIWPTAKAVEAVPTPEISQTEQPPIIPPPPVVPPPLIPGIASEPAPEPVLETAQASTNPSDTPPPLPEKASLEMQIGTYWLVRIGVVIVLAGLAFFANLAYHNLIHKLGPGGKISLLYLASGLLLGAGAWWLRRNVKESLKNFAQVLFAGGLAAVYFTTYAAHHIAPLRVINSALVDGTLLLAWAGVIAWIADRRKSEVMAIFAVGLAFFTSVITRVGEFTLYSNLILTITAVVFLVRNRWVGLSFASLLTSYAGYAFWRFLHADGWRWATPDENLRFGACFLACYWAVFTAATFLSKGDKLAGSKRAAFLTLNNGAFFALFLLTMLQVHTGGFWKFSLAYGSALLGLAVLARRILPAEPLTKNSYLTHGLVLVTLGFISKFAGLKLAAVLGAESVVLYVLATQRQSLILKFFAYAGALLATGWCAATFAPFDFQDLWMAAGLGALLAFNAFWAYRMETKSGSEPNRLECTAFTLLAFLSWTLATWFNTPEPHLLVGLVLAVESAVCYNLVGGHKIPAPKVGAYASAAIGVAWCLATFRKFDAVGLWPGITVGLLMLLNTLRAHRESQDNPQPLRGEPAAFTLFAFAAWLATTWFNTSPANFPLALAGEAVAFTFSIYVLRVREVSLLGQLFLILSQLSWLVHYLGETPPWWNPLVIIAATIGLSHWWQHQKIVTISRNIYTCYSGLFALAAVAVAIVWLHPLLSAPAWLAVTSLLAVAVTGYGLATRAWALAIAGQIFLAVSAWEFIWQLVNEKPDWYYPLAPLIVLVLLSFATLAWFARKTDDPSVARQPLLQAAMIYRWLALGMSLLWLWDYVPERDRVWAYMLAAAAMFALGTWRSSREALIATAVYSMASLTLLWLREDLVMDIYWPNLLSILALFVMQQLLRRYSAKLPLGEAIHGAIVGLAVLSLWRFLSCWTSQAASNLSVTMTWAGFAVVVFTAGIIARERFLRWSGLVVLASAIGRVVLVDIWKQETIYRVLTLMALGIAAIVIGFIYNKYQEKIRQWM